VRTAQISLFLAGYRSSPMAYCPSSSQTMNMASNMPSVVRTAPSIEYTEFNIPSHVPALMSGSSQNKAYLKAMIYLGRFKDAFVTPLSQTDGVCAQVSESTGREIAVGGVQGEEFERQRMRMSELKATNK